MKKYILFLAVVAMSTASYAQHTQTEPKTEITDKAMLDGKAFTVTLTENTSSTTVTPASKSEDRMVENPDLTKRDVEDPQPKKSGTIDSDPKDSRKMLLRFENGEVKLAGKGDIKSEKCPYKSWGIESTGISFSADCNASATIDKNGKSKDGTILTGTVNGDTIHGTMTCTKSDGTVMTYSYTGSKAGPNDLDMESEMGMK